VPLLRCQAVTIGALQLVQALCMRRVANCPFVPLPSVLRLYTHGRTGTVRAAAEGALVWLSRHPQTQQWLNELPQARAEPLVLRCRSLYESLQLRDRGTGWSMAHYDLRTKAEEETGLAIGDGATA
jgi:hypothetical protein